MKMGEQQRGGRHDRSWVWVGVGVAVVVVGVTAFLAGLYSSGSVQITTTTPPQTFFAPVGFGWVGAIFSIFFLFWVVSWFFRPWGWGYRRRYGWRWWRYDGASEILRERYARGEITKQQFEEMMRDLERHS